MGFNIKNNYGPNIEVKDGGKLTLVQGKDGLWHTADAEEVDYDAVKKSGITVNGDAVLEKKVDYDTKPRGNTIENNEIFKEEPQQVNFFAPKKNLQELLKGTWFEEVRTDEKYNSQWTDGFVSALMASEFGEGIARQWAVNGIRNKRTQLKAYVVGLLKDEGVLNGSYAAIVKIMGIADEKRQFSTYMSKGKKQPYAEWVKEYVAGGIIAL